MEKENKYIFVNVRVNKRQYESLKNSAEKHGFSGVCEYVRFHLFFSSILADKIDKIYKKVCETNE